MGSMAEFEIGKLRIPYEFSVSKTAKHVRIEMTMDAMRVKVPVKASSVEIEKALYKKRRWIVENFTELQTKYEQTHKIARFRTGAKVPYWGRLSKLNTQECGTAQTTVDFKNGFFVKLAKQSTAQEHDDIVEAALRDWLKSRLTAEAHIMCKRYAQKLGVEYKQLRVKQLSTMWGSCGKGGNVSLDWHLIFAPKRVLEYVIAHELTHLVERNHNQRFWNVLHASYGDYRIEHDWLMRNEHLLGYKRIPLNTSVS